MQDILYTILANLEKVGIGVIMFLGAYLANIALGAWQNVKIKGYDFDIYKVGQSLIKFVVLGLGIGLLTVIISIVPMYTTYIGIEIAPETMEFLDSIVIIGAFLTATIRYTKDAIDKLIIILGNS